MTKQPSGGAELTMRIAERRRALAEDRALGVRVTQLGGYLGVKLRPPPALGTLPVAKAWLELFDTGRRDAGAMAREACDKAGRNITSQAKANEAVKAQLRQLGKERLWKEAKVKSGRPPVRRG